MRDDIHKSAPANEKWRQFIKRCIRESDRDDRARESAERALADDCNREFSPKLLRQLLERCDSRQADFFGSKLDGLTGGHVMDQQLIGRLKMLERSGPIDRNAVERALNEVIGERAESRARAMRGHIMKERGPGVAESMHAINRHMSSLPVGDLARGLMANNGRLVVPPRKSKPVGMDDNIL